jgi:quinol monooxygenase YgiN
MSPRAVRARVRSATRASSSASCVRFLYEIWRSQDDLDRHNATSLRRSFMEELPQHAEGSPEAYFGAMKSPYPAT